MYKVGGLLYNDEEKDCQRDKSEFYTGVKEDELQGIWTAE